ncbi:hypothetical protein KDA00_01005 [Candidatus Saccharibacteria bacterium]|nr:hypothetical protein [Candidatus Saccharibacteria bacterium]
MEWNNRGGNAPQNSAQTNTSGSPAAHKPAMATKPAGKSSNDDGKNWRVASVALLFTITLLIVAVIAYLAIFKPSSNNQGKYVDTTKYQAVFLNGGQVYFGKITTTNSNFMKLNDIYYLRVNQQVQPNGQTANSDVQLVKLGCELHGPQDQMIINSDQIVFWENLKDDGQVAKAVEKYVQENPDGQKCAQPNSQSNTNSNQNNNTNTNNNSQSGTEESNN